MTKIKILFAIGRLSVGGAEKLLVRQLQAIDTDKFEPFLLTLFPEKPESFAKEIVLDSAHWKKLNFQSLLDLVAWYRLFSFLRKEKFNAVVTSLFSANLIARIAAIWAGIPVIITHEHNLYPEKKQWQIWADWWLAKWTDRILVDADAAKKFTAEQEKIPIAKFVTLNIPPLLELSSSDPGAVKDKLGIPRSALVVLTVSRLVEEKGHCYLIEAAKKVLSKVPNAYFVIVGWGHLESALKKLVKDFGLEDRIILPGKMDIGEVLPIADIYADPVLKIDLPVAIMEAFYLGKPVVASAVGDIPAFVEDGENGFLVAPKDVSGLAEKIILLLENESLRKKFGQAGNDRVRPFTLDKYMEKFEKLIQNSTQ